MESIENFNRSTVWRVSEMKKIPSWMILAGILLLYIAFAVMAGYRGCRGLW